LYRLQDLVNHQQNFKQSVNDDVLSKYDTIFQTPLQSVSNSQIQAMSSLLIQSPGIQLKPQNMAQLPQIIPQFQPHFIPQMQPPLPQMMTTPQVVSQIQPPILPPLLQPPPLMKMQSQMYPPINSKFLPQIMPQNQTGMSLIPQIIQPQFLQTQSQIIPPISEIIVPQPQSQSQGEVIFSQSRFMEEKEVVSESISLDLNINNNGKNNLPEVKIDNSSESDDDLSWNTLIQQVLLALGGSARRKEIMPFIGQHYANSRIIAEKPNSWQTFVAVALSKNSRRYWTKEPLQNPVAKGEKFVYVLIDKNGISNESRKGHRGPRVLKTKKRTHQDFEDEEIGADAWIQCKKCMIWRKLSKGLTKFQLVELLTGKPFCCKDSPDRLNTICFQK